MFEARPAELFRLFEAHLAKCKGMSRAERAAVVAELDAARRAGMSAALRAAEGERDQRLCDAAAAQSGFPADAGASPIVTLEQVAAQDLARGLTAGQSAVLEAYVAACARRAEDPRSPPTHILLHGPPGTGKSHLVKAIAATLAMTTGSAAPVVLAPTGVAAVASGGLTAHFFLGLAGKSTNFEASLANFKKNPRQQARLKGMCAGTSLFMLDEGGFWTCGLLLYASRAISIALGCSQDVVFGNKDVIMSADFFQNPPPGHGAHSVAEAMILASLGSPGLASCAQHEREAAVEVAAMLRTFTRFELTEQVRAKTDVPHTGNISAIRNTCVRHPVTAQVMSLYGSLSAHDMLDAAWRRAQFVVTTNSERVALLRVRLIQFARDTGQVVLHWYNPVKLGPVSVESSLLPKLAETMPSLHGYFVKGADAFLRTNYDPLGGLANRSPCVMESLTWQDPAYECVCPRTRPPELCWRFRALCT